MTDADRYAMIVAWSEEDGVFVADAPDLRFCSAHGDTPEQALGALRTAMVQWLDVARERGEPLPVPRFGLPAPRSAA